MVEALEIHVKGIVQGVGFRPFVYRLAKRHLINGWVLNAADGVHIHAEGESNLLDEFVMAISDEAPAASQVSEIELKEVPLEPFDTFEIRFSDDAASEERTLVSPDLATCDDCVRELFDPNDRRYHYPFINCTNCGPRFTIIDSLPYDRTSTSMRDFPMCAACRAEYEDPANRRFHAQPNACFECGPHISWSTDCGSTVHWGRTREESDAIFEQAVDALAEGKILAVKGLGGFHLVCDANNAEAVAKLRERKHRDGKAFAVMMHTLEDVREVCEVSDEEAAVLCGSQRPIVLLRKRSDACITAGVADALPELGVMLPYTPVQHLLLKAWSGRVEKTPPMLVMTSGNIHDEPIVTSDSAAYDKLGAVADAFLGNDREILTRFDDSVVRVIHAGETGEAIQFLRRARGYSPAPFELSENIDSKQTIFAVGPEQKNTFTFLRGGEAFVSQHIGDMENAETFDAWLEAKTRYEKLFEFDPKALACDLHPEYLTTKWAHEMAQTKHLPLTEVQHHHAHIASVMAEHHMHDAVVGFAFDGTGFGVDGAIWGGEVLLSNLKTFERFANFAYVPMPGGAAAIKNPLRMAYGVLWVFDLLDHPGAAKALEALGPEQCELCEKMIEQEINTPSTSSVGRLFDAASALLGICTKPKYEGEPAILLEAAVSADTEDTASCVPAATKTRPYTTSGDADASTDADICVDNHVNFHTDTRTGVGPRLCRGRAGEAGDPCNSYQITITKNVATETSTAQDTSVLLLDAADAFRQLLDDLEAGVPVPTIARRFHDAFVAAIAQTAQLAEALYGIRTVALSGGVFMNRYLIEHSLSALEQAGFTVAINRELPPGDGCISLGQAVVAWARETNEEEA